MALPVRKWILENFRESAELEQKTIEVVADFTLIWNLFEGVECSTKRGIRQFDQFVNEVSDQISDTLLKELLLFWKFRYVADGDTNDRFDRLTFRRNDQRELVADVLLERNDSTNDIILALLIIVYRLRNNLFHGLKTIDHLNNQRENLSHAIEVLQTLIPKSSKYLYRKSA